DPKIGPVSPQASEELARKVLLLTPEANFALSITGHLGPNAPAELNRKVFLAGLRREPESQNSESQNNRGLGSKSGRNLWLDTRECNLESARFFRADLSENRRFLQSLALWEALCFGEDTLKSLKILEFPTKNKSFEKNGNE
ncbi:MAG: hypothetical protein ACOVQM_10235, partial [Pirellula sp.]